MKTHTELRAAQAAAGLSDARCAEIVGVTPLTWKRWLGKTSRPTRIDYRGWELFLLKTGQHPGFELRRTAVNRDRETTAPGGCECQRCGCVFIGGPAHNICGVCLADSAGQHPDF